jgi:hypothetical protein
MEENHKEKTIIKEGIKAIVTSKEFGHGFNIGEEITVGGFSERDNDYYCSSLDAEWYLQPNEFKIKEDE